MQNEAPNILPGTMNVISSKIEGVKNNFSVCDVSGKGRLYYALLTDWGDYYRSSFKIAFILDGTRYVVNSAQNYPGTIGCLAKEAVACSAYSNGVRLYPMNYAQAGGTNNKYFDLNKSAASFITESDVNNAQPDKILMSQTALTFNESLKVEITAGDSETGGSGQYVNSAFLNIMYSLEE